MWRQRQRWELCSHRLRNAWNHQKLKEQRRTLSRVFVGSTDLLIPWFQTPSLQNLKRVYYHCLSLLVCGNLLWQPSETNTPLDSGLQGKATANTAHGEEARATWSRTYPSSHPLISHWYLPLADHTRNWEQENPCKGIWGHQALEYGTEKKRICRQNGEYWTQQWYNKYFFITQFPKVTTLQYVITGKGRPKVIWSF